MPTALEQKVLDALQATPTLDHEALANLMDYRERKNLLGTMRELERQGLVKRDMQERREGRRVLRYIRVTG